MQRHSAAIVPNVRICPRVKQQFGDVFVSPENRIVQRRITELVLNVRIRACVKQQLRNGAVSVLCRLMQTRSLSEKYSLGSFMQLME